MSINKRRLNTLNTKNSPDLKIKCPMMDLFEDIPSGFQEAKLPRQLRIVPKEFIVEDTKHKLNLPVSVLLSQIETNSRIFTRLWLSFPLTTT